MGAILSCCTNVLTCRCCCGTLKCNFAEPKETASPNISQPHFSSSSLSNTKDKPTFTQEAATISTSITKPGSITFKGASTNSESSITGTTSFTPNIIRRSVKIKKSGLPQATFVTNPTRSSLRAKITAGAARKISVSSNISKTSLRKLSLTIETTKALEDSVGTAVLDSNIINLEPRQIKTRSTRLIIKSPRRSFTKRRRPGTSSFRCLYNKKKFLVTIPSRNAWMENRIVFPKESLICYTDGSKIAETNAAGAGVYLENADLQKSYSLDSKVTAFQAEIYAIKAAAEEKRVKQGKENAVFICSDSQAALQALCVPLHRSEFVRQCSDALEDLANKKYVNILWVPGHVGILGNEKADTLAKLGTTVRANSGVDLTRTKKLHRKGGKNRKTRYSGDYRKPKTMHYR